MLRGSDILATRLVHAVLRDTFRAHPNGVYQYCKGAWKQIEEFSDVAMRHMEAALLRSAVLFRELSKANLALNWDIVFGHLQGFHGLLEQQEPITSEDFRKVRGGGKFREHFMPA
jgi:hypothetical protein